MSFLPVNWKKSSLFVFNIAILWLLSRPWLLSGSARDENIYSMVDRECQRSKLGVFEQL